MELSASILLLRSLSKDYLLGKVRVPALKSIDLELYRNEFVGLSGPSGSGKSTLLNIIGLTDVPSSGSVTFQDHAVDFRDENSLLKLRRSSIGYVFQYFNLIPSLSAVENVALSLLLNGKSFAEAAAQARELLCQSGLGHRLDHKPQELSGGEMQRVALCRAVIHRPALLLADEPTGNLDSHTGALILDLLEELAKAGTTILMASHNLEALSRCSRTIKLLDGGLL